MSEYPDEFKEFLNTHRIMNNMLLSEVIDYFRDSFSKGILEIHFDSTSHHFVFKPKGN